MRTKEWRTTSPETTQKRRYVYDRTLPYAQLLQEWDNVGNKVMADYLYLGGDLIGFRDERAGSTARFWILKDGQNSVRKVVDNGLGDPLVDRERWRDSPSPQRGFEHMPEQRLAAANAVEIRRRRRCAGIDR